MKLLKFKRKFQGYPNCSHLNKAVHFRTITQLTYGDLNS